VSDNNWPVTVSETMHAMFVLDDCDNGFGPDGCEYLTMSTLNNEVIIKQEDDGVFNVIDSYILSETLFVCSVQDVIWLCEVLLMGGVPSL
jgi:hypothetical protein